MIDISIDFSLPTQRCFPPCSGSTFPPPLFSAYAEVFRGVSVPPASPTAFLCLRRGVSPGTTRIASETGFSLPTQRCFHHRCKRRLHEPLFSAYAEVFPPRHMLTMRRQAFLCLRRGVSITGIWPPAITDFSLPTQRCFHVEPDEVA